MNHKSPAEDSQAHSGTWKLAYADFITTMMAFFLLMWLLAISSEEQKKGISNYFQGLASYAEEQPLFIDDNLENESRVGQGDPALAGGPMSIMPEGDFKGKGPALQLITPLEQNSSVAQTPEKKSSQKSEENPEHNDASSVPWAIGFSEAPSLQQPDKPSVPSLLSSHRSSSSSASTTPEQGHPTSAIGPNPAEAAHQADTHAHDAHTESMDHAAVKKEDKTARAKKENQRFQLAEHMIEDAVNQDESLRDFRENLIFQHVNEGLRVQIVDRKDRPLFSIGSAAMHKFTRKLLKHVADVIKKLPNQIVISGHTDAMPFPPGSNYSNWELSADRANASRKALEDAGLPSYRFDGVIGKEGTDPLIPEAPFSPQNRRISITILRENFKEEKAVPLETIQKAADDTSSESH